MVSSHPMPPPTVTIAQSLVTTQWNVLSTLALPVNKLCQDMLLIIVWRCNVISVVDGDTLPTSAIFKPVPNAMKEDMWWITVQSTPYLLQKLDKLMQDLTSKTTTSTPLWMMIKELVCIEPGAQLYEGGNVTIHFLSSVFFLISVVQRPYFHFAPLHEETNHYLCTHFWPIFQFPICPSLTLVSPNGLASPLITSLIVITCSLPSIKFYNLLLR